jgi:hypothetical protein
MFSFIVLGFKERWVMWRAISAWPYRARAIERVARVGAHRCLGQNSGAGIADGAFELGPRIATLPRERVGLHVIHHPAHRVCRSLVAARRRLVLLPTGPHATPRLHLNGDLRSERRTLFSLSATNRVAVTPPLHSASVGLGEAPVQEVLARRRGSWGWAEMGESPSGVATALPRKT